MQRTPFVGRGRELIVDGLLAAFDQVAVTRTPLWVSLEAPSGTGKTRVVHEFYERLAGKRQSEPAYWPPTIVGDESDSQYRDLHALRKEVGPSVKHRPGSLPAYLWWGIGASNRNGVRGFALESDVLALQQHGPYIDDAWRRIASWNQRNANWWRDVLVAGRDEAVNEAISQVLTATIGVAVPGVGLLGDLVGLAQRKRTDSKEREGRLVGDDLITSEPTELVAEVLATIVRISSAGLPVVIFVEDMHSADELMTNLLATLVEGEGAVLVVTTSWTGASLGNVGFQDALKRALPRAVRIDHRPLVSSSPFPDGASLGQLASADSESIVRAVFPLADERTARALVERYPNPLALELFCSIRRLRMRFADGRLELSSEEIARTPATLHDLYRDLWRELPELTRAELYFASLGAPATLSHTTSDVRSWQRELITQAADGIIPLPPDGNAYRQETLAPELHDWTATSGEDLWQFLEPTQFEIAASETDMLTDSERQQFYMKLADLLTVSIRDRRFRSAPRRRFAVDLAAAMCHRGLVEQRDYELALANYVRMVADMPEEAGGVNEVLAQWEKQSVGGGGTPADESQAGGFAWSAAIAWVRLGQLDKAEPYLKRYVELGHPLTFSSMHERELTHALLAECLAERAQVDQVWGVVREHLHQVDKSLGTAHPVTQLLAQRVADWGAGASVLPSLLGSIPVGIKDRPVFDKEQPPRYVVMNAIKFNPRHGDERRFALIRRVGDPKYVKELELHPGEEYEVYTHFHNNAASILNTPAYGGVGFARGLRLSVNMPTIVKPGERGAISSILAADNASPRKVWNAVHVTSKSTVALRYVPASAKITSGGAVSGRGLSAAIFTPRGTLLGYSELNGILPGGIDFAGHVTYRLKVDQPNFTVSIEVSNNESSAWSQVVTVYEGELLNIRVTYTNAGTTDQTNVTLKNALPPGVTYVAGSTTVVNPANPRGLRVGDDITEQGINIGTYGPGAGAVVSFNVEARGISGESSQGFSTVSAITRNGTKKDTAHITIETK